MVGGELRARADDADEAEDKSEDPAGTAVEAMAAADDECYDQGGEVDEQLEDGNAATRIELHFDGSADEKRMKDEFQVLDELEQTRSRRAFIYKTLLAYIRSREANEQKRRPDRCKAVAARGQGRDRSTPSFKIRICLYVPNVKGDMD